MSIFLLIALLASFTLTRTEDHDYYPGKWNDVNTNDIIDNERLFKKYKECIIEEKEVGCPQEALELHKILPEALNTLCGKCSPAQVEKIRETLTHICRTRKGDFDDILKKVDPSGIHRPHFENKFGKLNCPDD